MLLKMNLSLSLVLVSLLAACGGHSVASESRSASLDDSATGNDSGQSSASIVDVRASGSVLNDVAHGAAATEDIAAGDSADCLANCTDANGGAATVQEPIKRRD
jgi:hypothetical protein